jgi:5-formyltetrahydrofolate cyclo-ligase
MTKENLRKIYLQKRLALSLGDYSIFNKKLCENFFLHIDLSQIQTIHTFLPIEKTKEPDTWQIINKLQERFPHIRLSIPKINTQTGILDNFYFEGPGQLEKNTWGIPEPKQGIPTPPEKIDAVLVPLLVADKHGHRVGYGRGFYDKFLKICAPRVLKIGLSFFPAVENIKDTHPLDEKLNCMISPEGIFKFT